MPFELVMQKIVTTPTSQAASGASPCMRSIELVQTGETYLCSETETLLTGMTRLGKRGIPVGCVNGGCGVCKVHIRSGRVRKVGAMSRAHVSVDDEATGVCLACRVAPLEDVVVDVVGKMTKAFAFARVADASS
jgi:3-phenylpropionate/trans-cinnamate dioxygenase ferredoxin reductase subunit